MTDQADTTEQQRELVRKALDLAGLSPVPYAVDVLQKGRDFVTDFLSGKKSKLPREVLDDLATRAGFPSWTQYQRATIQGDVGAAHMAAVKRGVEMLEASSDRQRISSSAVEEDFESGALEAYVAVEVLPTFAGMGGGGTGDGDRKTTLLPRSLVEDDLRARAEDLLVIDLRGDSMVPDFFNGDRIVINRKDVNPVQPGPFALWDGDGYVVKNIERRRGSLRIFSSNPKYTDWESDGSDIKIMGRPVWFARRL